MTELPRVTVTAADGGWIVACSAGDLERWCARRPAADRVAHDHRQSHGKKER